ncbi:MAG TPA: hypothetical protein VF886_09865, partial [Roseiarcus sp.]
QESLQPSHSRSPSHQRKKAGTGHVGASANHPLGQTKRIKTEPLLQKILAENQNCRYDSPCNEQSDPTTRAADPLRQSRQNDAKHFAHIGAEEARSEKNLI